MATRTWVEATLIESCKLGLPKNLKKIQVLMSERSIGSTEIERSGEKAKHELSTTMETEVNIRLLLPMLPPETFAFENVSSRIGIFG